jgi:hypothetical protein
MSFGHLSEGHGLSVLAVIWVVLLHAPIGQVSKLVGANVAVMQATASSQRPPIVSTTSRSAI